MPQAASSPVVTSAAAPAVSSRPDPGKVTFQQIERRIDEHLAIHPLSERVETDVFNDAPYRVDYFNDDGVGRIQGTYWVQRIWIDLDRDGRWDEKWDRKLNKGRVTCTRRVAPADDEKYTEVYVDEGETGSWKRVK